MTTQVQHGGLSITGQQIQAGRAVEFTVTDDTAFPASYASVGAGSVGPIPAATQRADGRWQSMCVLDLTALPVGLTTLRVRVRTAKLDKSFTLLPDPQPGPGNTGPGVPDSELTPYAGGWITAPTTLTGVLITSPLVIKAPLTLRGSVVRCGSVSGGRIINIDSAAGGALTMEDTEVDGLGVAVLGIGYNFLTVRRCNIHSCSDGIRVNTDCLIEDTWIHDLSRQGTLHPDCIQSTGGKRVVIRHNTMDCTGFKDTGEADLGNSCVQLGGETAPLADYVIADNWLNGGNYTVNCRSDAAGPITLDGNRFGPDHRYGEIARPREYVNNMTVTGNTNSLQEAAPVRYW